MSYVYGYDDTRAYCERCDRWVDDDELYPVGYYCFACGLIDTSEQLETGWLDFVLVDPPPDSTPSETPHVDLRIWFGRPVMKAPEEVVV